MNIRGLGSAKGVYQNSAAIAIAALSVLTLSFFAFTPTVHADTPPCGIPDPLASGYLFSNYESDEYSNDLLTAHFKINPPYTEGRTFKLTWYYFDDGCNYAFNFYDANTVNVTMPVGTTDWSIRYASPTHLDVWDDQNNTIIVQKDIEAFPLYTSAQFIGSIDGGASTLQSRTLKIQQNGQPPVVASTTLPKDPACPSMLANGYYFDPSYEHAEYVDHLLRIHLRLLSPYNDGRLIWMQMLRLDASCNRDAAVPFLFSMPRATITPHIRYFSVRMTTPTHWVLWDDEHDIQIVCSFGFTGCEGTIVPDTPYVSLYGNIDQGATILLTTPYSPVEQVLQTCTPGVDPDCNSNVLFLPGIEASRLYRPQVVGDPEKKLWEPGIHDDLHDLYLNPEGKSVRDDVYAKTGDVLDETPIGVNIYQSFIDKMNDLESRDLINDWETGPYDWRLSLDDILTHGKQTSDQISYFNATDTPYLIQELKRLAATSRTGKVTIVAHSNGGLVAKALMEKLGPEAPVLIDKMIFVAVPQAGTSAALAAALHGHDQAIARGVVVDEADARTFASTSPMTYHLIPSAQYFTQVDDPVISFDASLPDWIARYGATIHSQERLHDFLVDSYGRVDTQTGDIDQPVRLSGTLLSAGEAVHADLDNWTPPSGVQLIQIAGWGVPTTVSGMTYTQKGTGVKPEPTLTVDGDGTVVVPSALWTSTTSGAENYWMDLKQYNKDHPLQTAFGLPFLVFEHSRILETDSTLNFITDQVANTSKPLAEYRYLSTQAPASIESRLRYSLHSPLTLNLFDDQGRHTGVSTTTGQVEEQIPGTYYMEFGETKYIFTDASTTAHILMEGYDTGIFTFNADQYVGDTLTASTTFKDIPTTENTIVSLDIQSDIGTLSPMSIDKDGDGTVDASIAPKLNDTVTLDTTPSEIQITFATSTNSLRFIGTDDMGTTTITATTTYPALKKNQKELKGIATTTVTVRDQAGNTTILVYTERLPSPEKRDTILLEEISYNGATTMLPDTSVSYKWRTDKNGSYKLFSSHIKTTATTTESHFRPKKNVTVLMSKPRDLDDSEDDEDSDIRPAKQILSGMVVPYIRTQEGRVIIGY
ncbi:hypothetical protein HZC00_04665 [Candidatus Kaiserbacteria bacterium]|nr:hypothetical protein [Candidatus Kaiserbacteria bacterium]